jgi:hypothetical protein
MNYAVSKLTITVLSLVCLYNASGSLVWNNYWHIAFTNTLSGRSKKHSLYSLRTLPVTLKIAVRWGLASVWEQQRNSCATIIRRNKQLWKSTSKVRAYPVITVSSDSESRLKTGSCVFSVFKWTLAHFCLSCCRLQADSLAMAAVLRPRPKTQTDR